MRELHYIDLFSGAGGMSLGFDWAGFKNVYSIENVKTYAETYKKNFPDHKVIIKDIRDVSEEEALEAADGKKIDLIIGGPPCQGFSIAGNIGRTFLDDERNQLFLEFVRFVKIFRPRAFILENVAAMATHRKGNTIDEIVNKFNEVGYNVEWKVLNTVDYGIAQRRRRIFIVGIRKDIKKGFEYPSKNDRIYTIEEVIGDLPVLESGEASEVPNHVAMHHTLRMLEKMRYIKDGGTRNDIPEELRPKTGDARKYIRYNSKEPSYCITGDMRKIFHYSQNRALTCRELARIQTFPDNFVFLGSSIQIQQQIGNAVPPKMAEIMAYSIKKVLEDGLSKD